MYSRSSLLLRGSTSTLKRYGDMESTNATEASSFPLSGGIGGTNETLTRSLGHTSTTELEALKNATEAETPQRQVYQTTTTPSVSKEPLATNCRGDDPR
jgi:hypothetical protein